MPVIKLETYITSTIEICFDLSRSIDLHQISTVQTNEKAIAGITGGLIYLDEFVTWEATHFGIRQNLTSKITAFDKPFYFRDEQIKGPFKYILHDHFFEVKNGMVIMKDIFDFQSPWGYMGKSFDKMILTEYLTGFLKKRNETIKEFAETTKWKTILHG